MFYAFDVRTGFAGAKPQQQQWQNFKKNLFAYFKRDRNESIISVLEPPKIKFFLLSLYLFRLDRCDWCSEQVFNRLMVMTEYAKAKKTIFFVPHSRHIFVYFDW